MSEPGPADPWNRMLSLYERALAGRTSPEGMEAARLRRMDEAREKAERRVQRLAAAGVPQGEHFLRLARNPSRPASPVTVPLFEALARRTGRTAMLVVLTGPAGTGKTAAMVRAIAEWTGESLYLRAGALTQSADAARSYQQSDARAALLATMERVSLLVVDDVAETMPEDAYHEMLVRRADHGGVTLTAMRTNDAGLWPRTFYSADLAHYHRDNPHGFVILRAV